MLSHVVGLLWFFFFSSQKNQNNQSKVWQLLVFI
jgi:hypothetical protein